MIRSTRGLVTIGLIVFVIGLLVSLPARVVANWVLPAGVSVNGLSGSAWRGSAREASLGGVYLQDLQWKIRPLAVLTGKVAFGVSAKPPSGFFEADVSTGLGGAVILADLKAAVPLVLVADFVGIRGLQGNASLEFERVELLEGIATAADGVLKLDRLMIPDLSRDALGGYEAQFFTQNNGVTASVEDTDGVVDLAGSLQIRSDRSYAFVAQVVTTPSTPESIRRQLRQLPPANDRGQQEIRLEGVL